MNTIALFPLQSVILPEGNMSLRIFESRYLRMIAECQKKSIGFGLCLLEPTAEKNKNQCSTVGTLVNVAKLERNENAMLEIDIVGMQRFKVTKTWLESDGLRKAEVDLLPNWQPSELAYENSYISHQLKHVFETIPQVGSRHSHCFYDDASWVSARWLELLPLRCRQFDHMLSQNDCQQAMDFLRLAIEPIESSKST